ncbi:MAG: hypothetical protein PHC66_01770 [Candidatus Nanoarchaeia archaeon]|nr:hypothetical protein [Candidatus Nanoarchaeia archaeon]MDD5238940.1 hypothetical protein [Candidatus Nanoarchaeia archaeon]
MNIVKMLIGIVILAIGAALVVGVLTQTTTTDSKTKVTTTNPGIIPIVLPGSIAGIPMVGLAGAIALIGVGVLFWGWTTF